MIFILIGLFIFGAAIGSFLNVVIDRSVALQTLFGRSKCDHCRATLKSIDLVPILSFAGLGGKCRYCRRKLSYQYPIVETLTGVLFSSSFFILSSSGFLTPITLIYNLSLISILIVVAVVDIKYYLIPTTFVFLASIVALFYNYFLLSSSEFVTNVFVALLIALFFLSLFVLTKGRGMGSGDIPLSFLIGLILGWPNAVAAIFLAFVSGALVSLVLVFLGKKGLKQVIPFGPFLVFSTITVLFWGDRIVSYYLSLL